MWKYMVQPDSSHDNITRRMCFACCITKATDTHSQCIMYSTYRFACCITKATDTHSQCTMYSTAFRGTNIYANAPHCPVAFVWFSQYIYDCIPEQFWLLCLCLLCNTGTEFLCPLHQSLALKTKFCDRLHLLLNSGSNPRPHL